MADDWLTEIWKDFMEPCIDNPAEGFDKVNLTLIATGDQKCEEFFNYDKLVLKREANVELSIPLEKR